MEYFFYYKLLEFFGTSQWKYDVLFKYLKFQIFPTLVFITNYIIYA